MNELEQQGFAAARDRIYKNGFTEAEEYWHTLTESEFSHGWWNALEWYRDADKKYNKESESMSAEPNEMYGEEMTEEMYARWWNKD